MVFSGCWTMVFSGSTKLNSNLIGLISRSNCWLGKSTDAVKEASWSNRWIGRLYQIDHQPGHGLALVLHQTGWPDGMDNLVGSTRGVKKHIEPTIWSNWTKPNWSKRNNFFFFNNFDFLSIKPNKISFWLTVFYFPSTYI